MELQFDKKVMSCLRKINCQTQTREETQDLRLPDTMPDIGRVLGCWGQILIRGKEWRSDGVSVSGGVMTWVLYAPEDGSEPRCMEGWIPFHMKWDLPESQRDGFILAVPTLKSMDVRSTSARKLMVRACVSIYADAMEPMDAEIPQPGQMDSDIQVLAQVYPMELPEEYGEKQFSIDEDLTIPNTYPKVDQLIYYSLKPQITEYKVMASRLVFRGDAAFEMLYCGDDGILHRWETSVPFSHFTELDRDHSSNSTADLAIFVTGLELEKGEENRFTLKSTLTAQYVIYDREMVCVAEDAYSTRRKVAAQMTPLSMPVRLDERAEKCDIHAECRMDASGIVDAAVRMDHPLQRRMGDVAQLEFPCQFQVLYYDADGKLQSAAAKADGKLELGCASENKVDCFTGRSASVRATASGEGITLFTEAELCVAVSADHGLNVVSGLEVGDAKKPDPARPSVILRRAGEDRLWDIAKEYGSTVEAIRDANHLQNDPPASQMLLIPLS